jgi:hypothetical protein
MDSSRLDRDQILESFDGFEMVRVAQSDQHALYRTRRGEWLVVPLADEDYGPATRAMIAAALGRDVDRLTTMLRKLRRRQWTIQGLAVACLLGGFALALRSATGSGSSTQGSASPTERLFMLGILLLALVCIPLFRRWGRSLGERFGPTVELGDQPYGHPAES